LGNTRLGQPYKVISQQLDCEWKMRVIWVVSFVVAHHKIVAGTSRSLNDGIGAYGLRLDFFVIHPV
jgi:hypothetical protein